MPTRWGSARQSRRLAYAATEKQSFPVLVVAPLVTLNNWEAEIAKFLKRKSRNGRIVDGDSPSVAMIRTGKRDGASEIRHLSDKL